MEHDRRPLKVRSNQIAIKTAALLTKKGVTPNQISVTGVAAAFFGSLALFLGKSSPGLFFCAFCVLARSLCNLFDGMVAIEGGKKTPTGILYNELPDRVSDVFFIAALGYASGHAWLGWTGAILALGTSYLRAFGGSMGQVQDFSGPMAKPQRMGVVAVSCVLASFENMKFGTSYSLLAGSIIISAGSAITCVLRTRKMAVLLSS